MFKADEWIWKYSEEKILPTSTKEGWEFRRESDWSISI